MAKINAEKQIALGSTLYEKTGSKVSETGSGHTLLALDCHSGLQVVHLQLQAFECAVGIAGLALVCNEDYDDDEQQQASSSPDADDGRQGEQTVRIDLQSTRGVLEPSNTHLHHTHKNTNTFFSPECVKCGTSPCFQHFHLMSLLSVLS